MLYYRIQQFDFAEANTKTLQAGGKGVKKLIFKRITNHCLSQNCKFRCLKEDAQDKVPQSTGISRNTIPTTQLLV